MVRRLPILILAASLLAACAGPRGGDYARDYRGQPLHDRTPQRADPGPEAFPDIGYATWTEDEPDYRLFPGDVLDITVLSAPELNRSATVQPDGRITLPLLPPVMVADRSPPQVEAVLTQAYASQLVRPQVSLSVRQATSLKVFVGGEVDKAGVYDMPGDIDALQAVIMAGGFKTSARSRQVVILRRGPDGRAMMRTVDLKQVALRGRGDAVPLRRFDVVYVPRSGLAEVAVFIQQLRDALPVQFSYVIGGQYVTN
jgi:polysaccharide export outer membrane protein